MDSKEEKFRACKQIHERARYFRGRFLNSVAVIERDIALILTDYFCTSDEAKRKLFFTDVITGPRFSLTSRKNVLVKIVQHDYPRYWKEREAAIKALDEIIRFRNTLAHSVVDVSDAALARPPEQGIGFVEWDGGKPITEREFDEWEVKAGNVWTCLDEIRRLLPFKEKPLA